LDPEFADTRTEHQRVVVADPVLVGEVFEYGGGDVHDLRHSLPTVKWSGTEISIAHFSNFSYN
jgi:hypothetical protein